MHRSINIHYRIKTGYQIRENEDENIGTGVSEPVAWNTPRK
jgi:hypothetical protein